MKDPPHQHSTVKVVANLAGFQQSLERAHTGESLLDVGRRDVIEIAVKRRRTPSDTACGQ